MASKVNPVPEGYHTVTPYLCIRGAAKALDFYARAFGAQEKVRMPGPDGKVMHAEILIGDSMVMLGDENREQNAKSPEALGGTPVSIMLYVPDVDAVFKKATAAGAKADAPPAVTPKPRIVAWPLRSTPTATPGTWYSRIFATVSAARDSKTGSAGACARGAPARIAATAAHMTIARKVMRFDYMRPLIERRTGEWEAGAPGSGNPDRA